ncbi:MAG: Gfo/Idh/MocA family oxidoreductase [Sneathiella sp.]|uniref:Gfo/Idh/MocA family protein n=1 Tax=Sneathiella sp. TaxID=1964365 RepID=UPI003001D4DC
MISESKPPSTAPVGIAVVGLGRGFMLTLPSILADSRLKLVAGCDPRPEARAAFKEQFNGRSTPYIDGLFEKNDVEVVYVASPHQFHRDHAIAALRAGKHVLIDKPIAINLADSRAIMDAGEKYERHVAIGPCHSFDPQIRASLALIRSGKFGRLRMLRSSYATDFMYRPRREEELKTKDGGGVVFSQGAHQIDIARLLSGGLVKHVTALTGSWDTSRSSEGAYAALLEFENGICANLTYSGYGHYDSDEQHGWISELGITKDPSSYGGARRKLNTLPPDISEEFLKEERTFGRASPLPASTDNEHFGELFLSLDRADIQVTPRELRIYGDDKREVIPVDLEHGSRAGIMEAIWQMARENNAPIQNAQWGHATLEVCHGILNAAATGTWQKMAEQVAVSEYPTTSTKNARSEI